MMERQIGPIPFTTTCDRFVWRAGNLNDDVFLSEFFYVSSLPVHLFLVVFWWVSPATNQLNDPYLLAIATNQLSVFASGS